MAPLGVARWVMPLEMGRDDLAVMLARVEGAGGKIAVPKTEIGNDFGFFAHFIDTEGNCNSMLQPSMDAAG